MDYVGLACAVALAGVFFVSVRGKLGGSRFRVFVATAGPLDLLPRKWRGRAATAAAVAESATVAALVAGGVMAVLGAGRAVLLLGFLGAAVLLLVFTIAIGVLLWRGERAPCHCFGVRDTPLGLAQVVRNVLLLALAVTGPLAAGGGGYAAPGIVLAVVAGAPIAALLVLFDDLVALFRIAPPRDAVGNRR
jgi:hypothetical protein